MGIYYLKITFCYNEFYLKFLFLKKNLTNTYTSSKALGMFKGFWNFKEFGNHLMPNTLILKGKSLKEITKW
jgi:hypothetical protein